MCDCGTKYEPGWWYRGGDIAQAFYAHESANEPETVICWLCGAPLEGNYNTETPLCPDCRAVADKLEEEQ